MRLSDKNNHVKILKKYLQENEYTSFLTRIKIPLERFLEEIIQSETLNISNLQKIYSELLGIGEGSTPQSDDIFLGVIAAISVLDPKTRHKLVNLAVIKYEDFTTKKSSILIRKFLRGNFPKEVKKIIKNLEVKDRIDEFENEVRKIKSIGESSGNYFLVGLLHQFQYYEKLT